MITLDYVPEGEVAKGFTLVVLPDSEIEEKARSVLKDNAIGFLKGIRLKPALIVHCGDHLRASWLFRNPHPISEFSEREKVHTLTQRFKKIIDFEASSHGLIVSGKEYYLDNEYTEGLIIQEKMFLKHSDESFNKFFVDDAIRQMSYIRAR